VTRLKKWYAACFLCLSLCSGALMILAFDDPMLIAKGFFFSESLLLIAFIDERTHEIPNRLLVPVLAAGLIHFQLMESVEGLWCSPLSRQIF
jgi:hypothetical protein